MRVQNGKSAKTGAVSLGWLGIIAKGNHGQEGHRKQRRREDVFPGELARIRAMAAEML